MLSAKTQSFKGLYLPKMLMRFNNSVNFMWLFFQVFFPEWWRHSGSAAALRVWQRRPRHEEHRPVPARLLPQREQRQQPAPPVDQLQRPVGIRLQGMGDHHCGKCLLGGVWISIRRDFYAWKVNIRGTAFLYWLDPAPFDTKPPIFFDKHVNNL